MSVQELESAVTSLSKEELASFSQWFEEYLADAWDRQIEADARAGKLDHRIAQADEVMLKEALRRDAELASGAVEGRSHEEVMQAAKRAIGCA